MSKKHGLAAKFTLLLLVAGLVSVALFFALQVGGNTLMSNYFEASDFQERSTQRRVQELQEYVQENDLSTSDTAQLTTWVKKQPMVLMEIYSSNKLLYTSAAPEETAVRESEMELPYYDWVSYYTVTFADGDAEVVIYADDAYRWYTYAMVAELVLSFLLFLIIFLKGSRGLVTYICRLSDEIQVLEGGNLDLPITVKGDTELSDLARSLDAMRLAFKEQREQEAAFWAANQTMITEMSHDLRTPLTTLLIYTEIVRYKKYENEAELDDYLQKIDAKACQIKQLSDNIFEYSLISKSRTVQLDPPKPFREVFHDALSEMVAYLRQRGYSFDLEIDWGGASIAIYPQYIKRLVDNVVSNIIKYADPAAPLRIAATWDGSMIGLSFSNQIKPNPGEQDGAQIGLTNMRTMMEKMNGQCLVTQTKTNFKVELRFPIC